MDESRVLKFTRQRQMRRFFDHHVRLEVSQFFAGRDPHFLLALAEELQVELFIPGQTILVEGEIGDAMYFLNRGTVEVFVAGGKVKVAELPNGVVFGEMAVISGTGKRMATIRALELCDCRVIQKSDFVRILNHFPAERRHYEEMGTKRVEEAKAKSSSSRRYIGAKVPGGRRSTSPKSMSKLRKPSSSATQWRTKDRSSSVPPAPGTSGPSLSGSLDTTNIVDDKARDKTPATARRLPRNRSSSPSHDSGQRLQVVTEKTLAAQERPLSNQHVKTRGQWKPPPVSARDSRQDDSLPSIHGQDQSEELAVSISEKEAAAEFIGSILAASTPRGGGSYRKNTKSKATATSTNAVDCCLEATAAASARVVNGASQLPSRPLPTPRLEAILSSPLNRQQAKGFWRHTPNSPHRATLRSFSKEGCPKSLLQLELEEMSPDGLDKPKSSLGMWWLPDSSNGISPRAEQSASGYSPGKPHDMKFDGASTMSKGRNYSDQQSFAKPAIQGTYIVTSWIV